MIWDNRATMHGGPPLEDTKCRRELRRVTTLDVPHTTPLATEAITIRDGSLEFSSTR